MVDSPDYIIYLVACFGPRNWPGFLSIYIGNKNHIGVVYSLYNNSPRLAVASTSEMQNVKYDNLLASCVGRE